MTLTFNTHISSYIQLDVCAEAILMSTHNIGFYEDLTKIIFELSSNIIKYTPYFFCLQDKGCYHHKAEFL